MTRPAIPAALKRHILVEAGHRCAIPTCRVATVEIAHIRPWAEVREHTHDNLIALCPTCHTRYDGGQIDRQSMYMYKQNLTKLVGRYGDAERRLIDMFVLGEADDYELDDGRIIESAVKVDSIRDFDFYYLLRDGLVIRADVGPQVSVGDVPLGPQLYQLTDTGRAYVDRIAAGRDADG